MVLVQNEVAHPQQNTPGPLLNVQGHGGEKQTAELNDENLEKGNMRKIGAGKKCQYSDVFLFRDVSWDAAYINMMLEKSYFCFGLVVCVVTWETNVEIQMT